MCSTSASLPRSSERNHADFYPEIQTQDEQAALELGGKGYLAIQSCEDGWDYTFYHSDYSVMDGGQLDAPGIDHSGSP